MARTVWLLSLSLPGLLLAGACGADVADPCSDGFDLADSDRCVRWVEVQRVTQPASPGSLMQLADGRVLGWSGNEPMRVLTPDALRWDPIEPPPFEFVSDATNLPDGSVLAVGGPGGDGRFLARWDPIADVWSTATSLGVVSVARAAPLADGTLLMVGHEVNRGLASWRYDSRASALSPVGDPAIGVNSLIALDDGRALKLGFGAELRDLAIELFDPATDLWTPEVAPDVDADLAITTTLGDAGVLLISGEQTEIYSPLVGSWRSSSSTIHGGTCSGITTLSDGTALAVGAGEDASAAIYDPQLDYWLPTLAVPRMEPVSCWTLLTMSDGRVLARSGVRSAIYQQEPPLDDQE